MADLLGVELGRSSRVIAPLCWPAVVFDCSTPLAFVREVLAAALGRVGRSCSLGPQGSTFRCPDFSQSCAAEHVPAKLALFGRIQGCFQRLGVAADLDVSEHADAALHRLRVVRMTFPHVLQVSERVGFRYCWHKQLQLSVVASYVRLSQNVKAQRAASFAIFYNHIKASRGAPPDYAHVAFTQLHDLPGADEQRDLAGLPVLHHQSQMTPAQVTQTIAAALKLAVSKRPPVPAEPAVPVSNDFCDLQRQWRLADILAADAQHAKQGTSCSQLGLDIPLHDYLEAISGLDVMSKDCAGLDPEQADLPCYYLPVVDVAVVPEPRPVYDLSVRRNPSFTANSIVAHNCPAETPEGHACGLVKNLALMTYITVGSGSGVILEFLEEWAMENLEEITADSIPKATKVFVNGCWVGLHRNPKGQPPHRPCSASSCMACPSANIRSLIHPLALCSLRT